MGSKYLRYLETSESTFLSDKKGQGNKLPEIEAKRPLRRSCSTPLQMIKNRGKWESLEENFQKIDENVKKTPQYFKRNDISISPNSRRRKGINSIYAPEINNLQQEAINSSNGIKNEIIDMSSITMINKENLPKGISTIPLKQRMQNIDNLNPLRDDSRILQRSYLLTQDRLKEITHNIIYDVLVKEDVSSKAGTLLCKEVSTNIRDKLKSLIEQEKKIVVTTYISPRTEHLISGIHVSVKCQTVLGRDECLTHAFEIDNLIIWVTILVADY